MTKLTKDEVGEALRALGAWTKDGDAIRRTYTFPTFADAVSFVVRVGFAAESVDHHPDILVSFRRVTLSYTTHSEKGLTTKDVEGARVADTLAGDAAREQKPGA